MKMEIARNKLCTQLRLRRPEIEAALATRVYALADPAEVADPDYVSGLRASLATALDYGLAAIEMSESRSPEIPPTLPAQARAAARNGVGLETVLGRYFAGYTLLIDYAIEEADTGGLLDKIALRNLLRSQGVAFERLIAAVSDDYHREASGRLVSSEQRRAERIRRLLAGELVDSPDLAYELENWHIGAVAAGPEAMAALKRLACSLDHRLLLVRRDDGTIWSWFGCCREADRAQTYERISKEWPGEMRLAVGEPAKGRAGWQLSHRQAKMAFPLTRPARTPVVRYSEVALAASVLQDDLLSSSLRQLYLDPLTDDRDGGHSLRETLRAYFAAAGNVSSAAAALGVHRRTVSARIAVIEERLGRDIRDCSAELEAALQLHEHTDIDPGLDVGPIAPRRQQGG
jgi:PucR-like helix-turn-helix protein/diguanylate cyclase with GGDEF domain